MSEGAMISVVRPKRWMNARASHWCAFSELLL